MRFWEYGGKGTAPRHYVSGFRLSLSCPLTLDILIGLLIRAQRDERHPASAFPARNGSTGSVL